MASVFSYSLNLDSFTVFSPAGFSSKELNFAVTVLYNPYRKAAIHSFVISIDVCIMEMLTSILTLKNNTSINSVCQRFELLLVCITN